MPISFDKAENSIAAEAYYRGVALERMRPISRKYDDNEHDLPKEWVEWFWNEGRQGAGRVDGVGDGFIQVCIQAEELCFGDAALYLRMPTPALGGSAVAAAGTNEQKARFLKPFRQPGHPIWGAMAITEPNAGSDLAALQTRGVEDGDDLSVTGQKV